MRLSIIAALADNNVIGRDNDLPWRMSADLKRFKALTTGHHMVMGRRTFESIGSRPLPNRPTIVITHDEAFTAPDVRIANSIEESLRMARESGDDETFIAGGAKIYEQTIHRADRMYLTRVHAELAGDTFFPEFDDVAEWRLIDSEHCEADEKNQYPYTFLIYERVGAEGHPIPEGG